MEKRRFGRTGHESTLAVFGAVALGQLDQATADIAMQQVMDAGVNHIDVAPSYGEAELRLGPWMEKERERFYLGCKTTERNRHDAAGELRRSLTRLRVKHFDLYQMHAVTSFEELDQVTARGGALEAALEAREQGLTRHIGITGHGYLAPRVFLEALERFDFDTVLFPINFIQYADPTYRQDAERLLQECAARDVGTMIIKSIARGPWGNQPQNYHMWYQPFDDREHIQQGVNFALSQPVTAVCTGGDYRILPIQLEACENFTPMSKADQEALIATAGKYTPLFAPA